MRDGAVPTGHGRTTVLRAQFIALTVPQCAVSAWLGDLGAAERATPAIIRLGNLGGQSDALYLSSMRLKLASRVVSISGSRSSLLSTRAAASKVESPSRRGSLRSLP